jgi:hypothetical protein
MTTLHCTPALSACWRQFMHADYMKISEPVFSCDDIKQAKVFWEAYRYFFNLSVDMTPQFVPYTPEARYVPHTEHRLDLFHKNLKKDYSIKSSLISYSIAHIRNTEKGLDDEAFKPMINFMMSKDSINLGGSRDFLDAGQLINKLTYLATSSLYVGLNCTWSSIAPMFHTPTVILTQHYPHHSGSIWTQTFHVDKKTGVPNGYVRKP